MHSNLYFSYTENPNTFMHLADAFIQILHRDKQ